MQQPFEVERLLGEKYKNNAHHFEYFDKIEFSVHKKGVLTPVNVNFIEIMRFDLLRFKQS